MMKKYILALALVFLSPSLVFAFETPVRLQIDINRPEYNTLFESVSQLVQDNMSQCALFVNRLFLTRFGFPIYGNAWDMQLKKENQKYLNLLWTIPKTDIYAHNEFALPWGKSSLRVDHYKSLYNLLDNEKYPIGVLGMIYRYSAHKEALMAPKTLSQTHVAFISGRKTFSIQNNTDTPQTVRDLLEARTAPIKDTEIEFVSSRVHLDQLLQPSEIYTYDDYLVEEHFKTALQGSLLEVFLRKHRNNKVDELLRPSSFSQISAEIIQELEIQEQMKNENEVEFVLRSEFNNSIWATDKQWTQYLSNVWNIQFPNTQLFIPVPHPHPLEASLQKIFPASYMKKQA